MQNKKRANKNILPIMTFKQLYNPNTGATYTIDEASMIFKIASASFKKQVRLKPHQNTILTALFKCHPQPISYENIRTLLINHQLTCPDDTRLHRKVSEIRNSLATLHPELKQLICNTRGIGYSLPLFLKSPENTATLSKIGLNNKKLQENIAILCNLKEESISLSQKCPIMKFDDGFILNRKPVHQALESILQIFDKQNEQLLSEIKLHPQDFLRIRIEYVLAKIKTYIGLARISTFSITKEQWLDWHEHELHAILEELTHLLKQSEMH